MKPPQYKLQKDLSGSQNGLGLFEAYPNVKIDSFGFNIDPENNYRWVKHGWNNRSEMHEWAEIYIFEICLNEKHEILHASIRKDEQQVIREWLLVDSVEEWISIDIIIICE